MNYTKEQNKEFAIKLVLMKLKKVADKIIAINRGDYTNKELLKMISKEEVEE